MHGPSCPERRVASGSLLLKGERQRKIPELDLGTQAALSHYTGLALIGLLASKDAGEHYAGSRLRTDGNPVGSPRGERLRLLVYNAPSHPQATRLSDNLSIQIPYSTVTGALLFVLFFQVEHYGKQSAHT